MARSKTTLLSILTLVAFLALAGPALAANQVYWANTSPSSAIFFANLDGSGGGGQLNTSGATQSEPAGVAIDPATNKIYWANFGSNTISYANLDGSGGGAQLDTSGATINQPAGIAIDPATNKIYWANFGNSTISYAKLDNTGGGGQLNISGASPSSPLGIAIDPLTSKIYWANHAGNTISYANLDGSGGGGQLNTAATTPQSPVGLAIDVTANKIYWANETANTIAYANLDGSGGGADLNTTGATPQSPEGLALDPVANKIYWANRATNTISYANLDNTGGGGQLNTSGATPTSSTFLALSELPSGAGAPTLSGGSTTGSTLTCSQGTWADDLLGAFLSRAPQRYTYGWTLNGSTISGASANTITATSPGTYACQVTASNYAGAAAQSSAGHTVSYPPAVATTGSVTTVRPSSATLNGTANPNGSGATYYFQYGTSIYYGHQTSTGSAGSDSTTHSESASISGLSPGKTYHFRIVVQNSAGTSYAADATFITPRAPLKLRVSPASARPASRACFSFTATSGPYAAAGVTVRFAGHSRRTSRAGKTTFCMKLARGTYQAVASNSSYRAANATVRVMPPPKPARRRG